MSLTHRTLPLLLLAIAPLVAAPTAADGSRRTGARVAAGGAHSCAIVEDGTVRCWGDNAAGQLGNGTVTDSLVPVTVNSITSANAAIALAAGNAHTCALLADGTVQCWGRNTTGQLGNNNTVNTSQPVQVSGLTGVKAIAAGLSHTCAVRFDGRVHCWGLNANGQLGEGSTVTQRLTPVPVERAFLLPLTGIVTVAAGQAHTCALDFAGRVWCWGANSNGQVGNPLAGASSRRASQVTAANGFTSLAAGSLHSCGLRFDGTLRCWGGNSHGQIGDGTVIDRSTPVTVSSGAADVKAISAGQDHTCLLRGTGVAECWGLGTFGQAGDGTFNSRSTPTGAVSDLSAALEITAGRSHSCAISSDDAVRCWGRNDQGQIGDGSVNDRNASEAALGSGTIGARAVRAAASRTCAIRSSGAAACWGEGLDGGLGNGSQTNQDTAVAVTGLTDAFAMGAGGRNACAALAGGGLRCWGANALGQLGNGTNTESAVPVAVSGLPSPVAAAGVGTNFACALTVTGAVFCWGGNQAGQLGNSTQTNSKTPVAVSGLTDAVSLSVGSFHSCAVRVNGSVLCWGHGFLGALGDGSGAPFSTVPVTVSNLTDAVQVTVGEFMACALRAAGSMVCWGANTDGQLGNGSTAHAGVPVAVSGVIDAVMADAGDSHTCALRATGRLTCWGSNSRGQAGNNSTVSPVLSPTVVQGLTGVTSLTLNGATSIAMTGGGQLFGWGNNNFGQLGIDSTVSQSLPAAVLSFSFNVLPNVTMRPDGRKAEVTALANCPDGARARIDVLLMQQGAVGAEGHANVECTGRLERYAVDVSASGKTILAVGPAVVQASAEVRRHGGSLDQQNWTRTVTIQPAP